MVGMVAFGVPSMDMHGFLCLPRIFFKIGRALWALVFPIRLGKFQLGLDQTQRKRKTTATKTIQHTPILKSIGLQHQKPK
jgi:hypothetical protein